MRCLLLGAITLSVLWGNLAFGEGESGALASKKSCSTELSRTGLTTEESDKLWKAIFDGPKDEPTDAISLAVLDANPPYRLSGEFYKWSAQKGTVLPFQGWKFHIAADETNIAQVLKILPELRKMGVTHKIPDSDYFYFESLNNPQDSNRGKFITVYPKDDAEASAIASLIDGKLKELGLSKSQEMHRKLVDSNLQKGDVTLGESGLFFARYGGVGGIVERINGTPSVRVNVNGKTHTVAFYEGINGMLVNSEGQLVKDDRRAIPDWVEVPRGIRELMPTRN